LDLEFQKIFINLHIQEINEIRLFRLFLTLAAVFLFLFSSVGLIQITYSEVPTVPICPFVSPGECPPILREGPWILPQGSWSINSNGTKGILNITSVSSAGNIMGTVFGDPIINGSFHNISGTVTFTRIANSSIPMIYSGHMFWQGSGVDTLVYTLAGDLKVQSKIHGWYAIHSCIVIVCE